MSDALIARTRPDCRRPGTDPPVDRERHHPVGSIQYQRLSRWSSVQVSSRLSTPPLASISFHDPATATGGHDAAADVPSDSFELRGESMTKIDHPFLTNSNIPQP